MSGIVQDSQDGHSSGWDLSGIPNWVLRAPNLVQLGLWFALVLAVKFNTLFEPPVWDSAMGVFPPAIELYRSGWDVHGLLQQGNWWMGGPNVHSLSLFTWFVAAVMTVTQNATATFAVVHLTTFLLVAAALHGMSRTLRARGVEEGLSLAAPMLLLCLPLASVQIGYLYTESWVMAFGVFAWAAWSEDSLGKSVLWAGLAIFIKLTGLAIAASVGLALLFRVLGGDRSRRVLLLFPVLPIALVVVRNLGRWLGAAPTPGPRWGDADTLGRSLFARLSAMPDVTLLLVAGMACGLTILVLRLRHPEGPKRLFSTDSGIGSDVVCAAMPIVFAGAVAATVFGQILFLPRYVLPAIPFAIAAISLVSKSLARERIAMAVILALAVFGVLNWSGRFYSTENVTFSVVERSHAYQDYHAVQRELIDALGDTPPSLPIFVSKEIDYMTSDPMMGYVDTPLERAEPLYDPKWALLPFEEYPAEFILAFSNPGHGGEVAARLLETARSRQDVAIRTRVFEREGFRTALFWIQRQGTDLGSRPPIEAP